MRIINGFRDGVVMIGVFDIRLYSAISANQIKKNAKKLNQKSNTLTTNSSVTAIGSPVLDLEDGIHYKKLTVTEAERLQTLPDNYSDLVSETQRRRMIGNGWTVDVISHILNFMNQKEPINVLSTFDGMSCGQLALQRAGVPVKNYFASEIDKYAIKVTMANFPNTVQLGSITDVSITEEGVFVKGVLISSEIPDLLIGGSPCQGFSFAGKQLNFEDPRSALFFEFVRIYKEIKTINPNVKFLLENVKMKKEYMKVITDIMEVEPVEINSALVSAQNRKRLYWTNINDGLISQPEDRNIFLKDIIHENSFSDRDKSNCITAGFQQTSPGDYFNRSQGQMVFDTGRPLSEKEVDYMLNDSGNWSPSNNNRFETYLNYPDEKHHCVTANFNKGVPYNCAFEELKKYIVPFEKTLQILNKELHEGKMGFFRKDRMGRRVYFITGKSSTIAPGTTGGPKLDSYFFGSIIKTTNDSNSKKFYTFEELKDNEGILIEGYIRKLTPIECERLQTVPDNYTSHVSDSQRYRMLGNGWTVDVIVHIFKSLQDQEIFNDVFDDNFNF